MVLSLAHADAFIRAHCPEELPRDACLSDRGAPAEVRFNELDLPLNATLTYVHSLLQNALEVEHSTIPLYLSTQYSLVNQTSYAATTMRSIVMEEMLHMVNAANVLNAVGGAPFIDHPNFIPTYPLVVPFINMTVDLVWFTQQSIEHYQVLESTPPGGYNTSISAAYQQIVGLLTALCGEYGEKLVFSGNASLQVSAATSYGQAAVTVTTLADATAALIGVADQGGGCPVTGQPWPETVNISAGPLGGDVSHSARYAELLLGRAYNTTAHDAPGTPTGALHPTAWSALEIYKFAPNPTVDDYSPESCVAGGKWVTRNSSFWTHEVYEEHKNSIARSNETSWEACARKCAAWTMSANAPLNPCTMWSWLDSDTDSPFGVKARTCLLAQGGLPSTRLPGSQVPTFLSGCLFGTVCNETMPGTPVNATRSATRSLAPPPPPNRTLLAQCAKVKVSALEFAGNYTAMLVSLHNVFNGAPSTLYATLTQMYALKTMAVELMATPDPRIEPKDGALGVGPPWEYVSSASKYAARGGRARPIVV